MKQSLDKCNLHNQIRLKRPIIFRSDVYGVLNQYSNVLTSLPATVRMVNSLVDFLSLLFAYLLMKGSPHWEWGWITILNIVMSQVKVCPQALISCSLSPNVVLVWLQTF